MSGYCTPDQLKPNPGDLIEIKRGICNQGRSLNFGPFAWQHWALYEGQGCVIHLTTIDDGNSSGFVVGSSSNSSEGNVKINREELKKVVGKSLCRVNNLENCLGSRNINGPLPVKEILERARSAMHEVRRYNVLEANCEHFVTWCRYGKGFSGQGCATKETCVIM